MTTAEFLNDSSDISFEGENWNTDDWHNRKFKKIEVNKTKERKREIKILKTLKQRLRGKQRQS